MSKTEAQPKNIDRREYFRKQKRKQRTKERYAIITSETMKEEHRIATKILSRERFFYE